MNFEEEALFPNAEADIAVSAKASRARKRVDSRLRDRQKKRWRELKKGHTDLPAWLSCDELSDLATLLQRIDTGYGRSVRSDRVNRQDNKALKPVPKSSLSPGVIVDSWVPFADGTDYKRRPAVVVDVHGQDVRVFPLTTSNRHRQKLPTYQLVNWRDSGLARPSGMSQRLVTIPRTDVLSADGALRGEDCSVFYAWANAMTHRWSPAAMLAKPATSAA